MKRLDIFLQNARIKKAVQYVRTGNQILDIGSGDGSLFKHLKEGGILFNGVGLDPEAQGISEVNYRILKEKFPNVLISTMRFDIITALAVLEHIPRDEQDVFALNCNRHLETGGLVVITVPSKQVDHILGVLIRLRIIDGMEVGQHYGYDTDWTVPLFSNNGFELVKHERFQLGLNNLFVFKKTSEA